MKVSRLSYDKMHRCPGWSGAAWKAGPEPSLCPGGASFASFMYERKLWRWRFTRCRECRVVCLPYVTRWIDPAWIGWRLGRTYREIYKRLAAESHVRLPDQPRTWRRARWARCTAKSEIT